MHHQEETLKAVVRLGLLGLFVALAAAIGVATTGRFAAPADAQVPAGLTVTKACLTATIPVTGETQCTIVVTATAAATFTEPLVLTLIPATNVAGTEDDFGQVVLVNGVTGATGPDVDTVVVVNPIGGAQAVIVSCTGATCDFAAGDTITIVEGVRGAVGGTVNEALTFGAGAAVPLTPSLQVLPATTTDTLTCDTTTPPAGATVTCVNELNDNDIFPDLVAGGTLSIQVTGTGGGVLGTVGGVAVNAATFTTRCGTVNEAQTCDAVTFTLVNSGPNCGPVTITKTYTPDPLVAVVNAPVTVTFTDFVTFACQTPGKTMTKTCAPALPDGVPNPAVQLRVGQSLRCTVTITQPGFTGTISDFVVVDVATLPAP
jgi:hypothetical protein